MSIIVFKIYIQGGIFWDHISPNTKIPIIYPYTSLNMDSPNPMHFFCLALKRNLLQAAENCMSSNWL